MSSQATAKQSAVAAHLPRELVQHIFSVKEHSSNHEGPAPVLDLEDRVGKTPRLTHVTRQGSRYTYPTVWGSALCSRGSLLLPGRLALYSI